jgi:hypothetical protein
MGVLHGRKELTVGAIIDYILDMNKKYTELTLNKLDELGSFHCALKGISQKF